VLQKARDRFGTNGSLKFDSFDQSFSSSMTISGITFDRDDETQIVSLVVRRNLPTSSLRNVDERHHARTLTARHEYGIRVRYGDSRRIAIESCARDDEVGLGFFTPVKAAMPEDQFSSIDPALFFLAECGPGSTNL
jgi:hypothetical protein